MQQQTLQQVINITVGDATNASGALASTGTSVLPLLASAAGLFAIFITALLIFQRKNLAVTKLGKIGSHGTGLRSYIALAVAGASMSVLAIGQHIALAAPTLAIVGSNTLTITVPQGGGAATTTTIVNTATANASGYQLTAALTKDEPGIGLSLKGGNVITNTPLTTNTAPLTLANTTTANATPDNLPVELTFTVDSTVTSGTKTLTLSYLATDNTPTTPAAPTTMQSLTKDYCTNHMATYDGTNEAAILTLQDPRGVTESDYQTYQVAKLADGNCWMLNNLKLGSATSTLTLTPQDTNVATNFTLPQVKADNVLDASTDPGNSFDTPQVHGPVPGDDPSSSATNYGYLYNWPAATASETRTTMPGDGTNNNTAPYSICPANWRLPNGGQVNDSANEFSQLNAKMAGFANNQDTAYQADSYQYYANWQPTGAFKGAFAGDWWGGFRGQGGSGYLWSGSAYPGAAGYAFRASFNPSRVNPGSGGARLGGVGVRCLLN